MNRKAQGEFDLDLGKLELEIDAKLQAIHPDELKRVDPANGFKNGPKEGAKVRKRYLNAN